MPSIDLSLTRPCEYAEINADQPGAPILLLHGYQQKGAQVLARLGPHLPKDRPILAPNAPFPIPVPFGSGYMMGFAWYFFDPKTSTYWMDMEPAVQFLLDLLERLQIRSKLATVIGYSQGGYLAPFLAERLTGCSQVIGVGCRFRDEALASPGQFRLDACHGGADLSVDCGRAKACHEQLRARGYQGVFKIVAGEGHRLSPALGQTVAKLLEPNG